MSGRVESPPTGLVYPSYVRPVSQEIVRCLMGYIVNLSVILDGISRASAGITMKHVAQEVMDDHVRSGRRDSIHGDIRGFVTETFPNRFDIQDTRPKDLVLERIIYLTRQYCATPPRR